MTAAVAATRCQKPEALATSRGSGYYGGLAYFQEGEVCLLLEGIFPLGSLPTPPSLDEDSPPERRLNQTGSDVIPHTALLNIMTLPSPTVGNYVFPKLNFLN